MQVANEPAAVCSVRVQASTVFRLGQDMMQQLLSGRMPSVEMSHLRVAERVAHGGHDIPAVAIERRFARSMRNLFALYAGKCDP
jgi:hypothetical protein